MEVNELVSVIVPIYNVEDTLERCIDSILQQTYMNIEIILVNDSSPDDSETICQKYKSEHPNIIKYFKKENEGLGLTRNYGMKRANGNYVVFVDSDDYIEKDMITQMMQCAVDNNADIVASSFVYNGHTQAEVGGEKLYIGKKEIQSLINRMSGNKNCKTNDQFNVSACTKLYSKHFLDQHVLVFKSEREYIWEDMAFNVDAFSCAERIYVMDSAFYHYDYNPESLTHSYDANRFEKIMKMYCYLKDKLNDIGMYDLCKFRLSNNFLGNARTTFKLEALFNEHHVAEKNICRMLKNEVLQEIVTNCDSSSLSLQQKIFNIAIVCKRPKLILFLSNIQNIRNKGIIN